MSEDREFRMLTVPEVGKILGVGRASAYNLVRQDGFPVIKIGRHLKVPKDALYRWITNQTAG